MKFFIVSLCIYVFSITGYAADPFDVDQAKAELLQLETKLQAKDLSLDALDGMYDTVVELRKALKHCISDNKIQVEKISLLMKHASLDDKTLKSSSYLTLKQVQGESIQTMTQCTLLLYQSHTLKNAVEAALLTKSNPYFLKKQASIWELFQTFQASKFTINLTVVYYLSGIEQLEESHLLGALTLVSCLGVALALFIFFHLKWPAVRNYLPFVAFFFVQTVFFIYAFGHASPLKSVLLFTAYFFITSNALMMIAMGSAFFLKKKWITKKTTNQLMVWAWAVASFGFALLICASVLRGQTLDTFIFAFIRLVTLVLVAALFLSLVGLVFSFKPIQKRFSNRLIRGIFISLYSIMGLGLVLDAIGYYKLSMFFIPNVILSLFAILVLWLAFAMVNLGYRRLMNSDAQIGSKLRTYIGVAPHTVLLEFFFIRALIFFALSARAVNLFMMIWGVPRYYSIKYLAYFEEPQLIFGVEINIQNILRAILFFCLIVIMGRFLSGLIARVLRDPEQKQLRITITTIVHYIAILLGLIISLRYAGFNFSQFALIAGALSVGIGFGLKSTVTDLLSGLILLTGRIVKPGDYIIAGTAEGLVRRISLLSTSIKTMEKADVIIPNSFLVSNAVKNHTYHSALSRVTCKVQIEKIENLKLAEKTLLEVASKNKNIIHTGKNKPVVRLDLDSGIYLTLWCVIENAHIKDVVVNELNHAVVEKLKAKGINIKV